MQRERIFWEGWAMAIFAFIVGVVIVGIKAGWIWAALALVAAWFAGCVVAGVVSGVRQPALPPRPRTPPSCGGIAEGCPVCLVASVALGVMVGDWLSGD